MKIHALNSLEFKVSVVRPSSARSIEIVETTTAVTVERLFVLCILFGRAGERASGFRRDYKFVHIGLGFLFFFFFFPLRFFLRLGDVLFLSGQCSSSFMLHIVRCRTE